VLEPPTRFDLVQILSAALRELATDLGYRISDSAECSDTVVLETAKTIDGRSVELVVSMEFHGAALQIAITIDPIGWDQKTSAQIDAYFGWAHRQKGAGIVPVHFTGTEINAAPLLCADQILNHVIDFQTGRIVAAASGAA
jgi:hypothetical protein